jgi:hypothetical protein
VQDRSKQCRSRHGLQHHSATETISRCSNRNSLYMLQVEESATPAPVFLDKEGYGLGSGRRGCLLRHATSSKRQGGQEHRDMRKRHSSAAKRYIWCQACAQRRPS